MVRGFLKSVAMMDTHVLILTLLVLGDLCALPLVVTCPFLDDDDVSIPQRSLAANALRILPLHKPCLVYFRFFPSLSDQCL